MSPRQVELALKKQRLQLCSAELRISLAATATSWMPAFAAADRIGHGLHWLRRHPALPVTALAALLVMRPRAVLRWAQRGFLAWRTLLKLRALLGTNSLGNH